MNILTSATKITLIILILALVYMTAVKILDTKPFETVLLMVVSFYFGQKTNIPLDASKTLQ